MTIKPGKAAQVCRQLVNLIGADRYELWFSDQSISINGNKLIVAAENEFSSDCQRNNFRKELAAIAHHQIGADASVVFCVKQLSAQQGASLNTQNAQVAEVEQPAQSESTLSNSSLPCSSLPNSGQQSPQAHFSSEFESEAKSRKTDEKSAKNSESKKRSSSPDSSAEKSCYNRSEGNSEFTAKISASPTNTGNLPNVASLSAVGATQSPILRVDSAQNQSGKQTSKAANKPSNNVAKNDPAILTTNQKFADDSQRHIRRWESLESFVIDSRNNVAALSASQVVSNLGEMSPFFLCGPTGSGKSHLLEGICLATRRRVRPGRVMYMTAAQYTTQFLEHLNQKTMPMFRQQFNDLDVFLLDDVQFFQGKRATIVELVQLVDNLARRGRQMVFAADRNLAELSFLGTELTTRISSGLVCRIDYPSAEGRGKIVRQAADNLGLQIDDHVVELLAERIAGDLRHIRGAMNRLRAYNGATGEEITVERARKWLSDIFQTASRVPTLSEIEDVICDMFGLDDQTLRSDQKVRSITKPRMLAMWLSRKYTRKALSEIGDYFGGRSHSTVLSARKKVNGWMESGENLQTQNGELSTEDAIRHIETKLHVG